MIGLDVGQFRAFIVKPTLVDMAMWSQEAENLLVGTALAESGLRFLTQHNDGPAAGIFQMEPATAKDIVNRYLARRGDLATSLERTLYVISSHQVDWANADEVALKIKLTTDLRFACALARLKYWMDPQHLPEAHDIPGLGETWKRVYNSAGGAGEVSKFISLYRRATNSS
jgi:hypothetical protein